MTTSRTTRLLLAATLFLAASTAAAAPVTDVRLQNTGAAAQTAVPITFGQVFAVGDVKKSDVLTSSLAGAAVPLQVDVKATHADGSVRHAIISAVVPKLAAGTTALAIATGGTASTAAPASFRDADATANVTLTIAGVKYTAPLADALASTPWLAGPIASEAFVDAPLKNAVGAAHPMLTVRYGVRWYPGAKAARIEVVVENTKTWQPNADQYTYDVTVEVAGKTAYSKQALTHYHHSRWHQYFWTGATPAIHVQHNTAYLIASKAVSNYEQLIIPENILADWGKRLSADNTGPMKIGTVIPDMHNAGGRGDIGPLPDFSAIYLLSMDKRAKDVMMANADGSGSWNMHYRDETTGAPIRTDSEANKRITTHWNAIGSGPLPVPRFTATGGAQIYSHDPAHEPSLAYLPYLVTGDRFYLEELQFWAATNPLETSPENHAGQGLMRWHQMRGQAWGLRTLADAAYATPDTDPMKAYFVKQVGNNINFYHQTYVVGNPNNLGAYDGSGEYAFIGDASSSLWQDAYVTWVFGYFTELGFDKARPVFEWKSKYAIGRLTDPGFCPIMSTAYNLGNFHDKDGKVYSTFADLYKANYGGDMIADDSGWPHPGPAGKKFIDLPCGSQEQADYLGSINGFGWPAGRFVGYSDFVLGNPALTQPSLALAVTLGVKDGQKAWNVFDKRLLKAAYKNNPQWNIVPRNADGSPSIPVGVQPPSPATAAPAAPATPSPFVPGAAPTVAGTWARVGYESASISLPANSIVRFGIDGAYVYGAIGGTFAATNEVFGRDPAVGRAKQVEIFTPATPTPAPAARPGTITTPSSVTVAKLKGLTYRVFDPVTGVTVKEFTNISPSSKNVFTLSDVALVPGATNLAGAPIDPKTGVALTVQYPLTVK